MQQHNLQPYRIVNITKLIIRTFKIINFDTDTHTMPKSQRAFLRGHESLSTLSQSLVKGHFLSAVFCYFMFISFHIKAFMTRTNASRSLKQAEMCNHMQCNIRMGG